ncbi:MAG: carotenoid biosynthesis protein [Bacteroidota bacterium]
MSLHHQKKPFLAIFLIWLFHLSAIIGVVLGYKEWFIEKTPLNFLACTVLFIWIFPLKTGKNWTIFGLFFFIGMLVEWLGANHSLLFGSYNYGNNLGIKIDGVPLFIGINWALLTFITGTLSSKVHHNIWVKSALGALLMVLLDFFMEQSAPSFDFWSFGDEVPVDNYVTWFVLAFVFHFIYQKSKIQGNFLLSLHLFLAQTVFFGFFTLFPF